MICTSHRRRQFIATSMGACALVVCAALFFEPPETAGFWPACPIHQLLGIECPGCGATRALAALMHGQLREAMRLNLLFVFSLPFGIAGAIQCYRRALEPGSFRWPQLPAFAIYSIVAISAVFTVARNIVH